MEEALVFLTKQPCVHKTKAGVLGISMGGRVAAILASRNKRIKFAVLYSPALRNFTKDDLARIGKEAWDRLNRGEAIESLMGKGWYHKKAFFETLFDPDYQPLNLMERIKIPVLSIQGDEDKPRWDQGKPRLERNRRAFEIVKSLYERNELHVVRGGDHTFSKREHTHEVIEKTIEWLDSLGLET